MDWHDHITTKSDFLKNLQPVFGDFEIRETKISRACDIALEAHEWQIRKYDESPFIWHPMAIALDVAKKYQDGELIVAALLHDVVEDCEDIHIEDVYKERWDGIWWIVESVTDCPLYFSEDKNTVYRDKIEKPLAGGMKDVRVLLLKIADRDHNLITLDGLKPHKQIRMTFETQAIYSPLRDILLEHEDSPWAEKIDSFTLTKVWLNLILSMYVLFDQPLTFTNLNWATSPK